MPAEADRKAPLDELMMAMDVVDTLRHDERIALKELDADTRDAAMIARLREIYTSQGIAVSDRILQEGVESLKQNRFVYAPPAAGFQRTLALLYVNRARWGKWLLIGVVLLLAAILAWRFLVVAPRERAAEALRTELSQTLPADLDALSERVANIAEVEAARTRSATLVSAGKAAAADGDADTARRALADLRALEARLLETFEIRIVSRQGVPTGVTRIPDANRSARNYYLVVEAIGSGGAALPQAITSEENNATTTVSIWAQRVPQATYDAVRRDKEDDGIVQDAILGTKARGRLEPVWRADVQTGAIVEW